MKPSHAGITHQAVSAQDFLEMLPIPEVTHPKGPLNMHGYFPDIEIKPDLGPKSYIALGK